MPRVEAITALRNKQLAAIHVMAAKRLRLDRETYVALLQRVAGVDSAGKLDGRGRAAVLDELRRVAGEGQRQMRNAVNLPDAPQNVREEIAGMGPVRLKDVEDAQAYLVAVAKDLAARGEIVIAEGDEGELVY